MTTASLDPASLTRSVYVRELGRDLRGRMLEIWQGKSDLPAATEEFYRDSWRREAGKRARNASCVHLGADTGRRLACTPCGDGVKFKIFSCNHPDVGPDCTLDFADQSLPACRTCSKFVTETIPEKTISLPVLPSSSEVEALARDLRFGFPDVSGASDETLRAAHLVLLREAVESPPPVRVGEGRGVVIGVGGTLYFGCAYVVTSVLRSLGCDLPVEWWHLGPSEIDPTMRRLATDLGAACVDAIEVVRSLPPDRRPRILNGWELKPFSVAHSAFREVLYLDADSVPTRDPSVLFDDPEYLRHGAMFWPDLPPYDRAEWTPEVVWRSVGLAKRDEVDFESGQFLVDKGRRARELGVTVHLNDHSDWYYKLVYGDKTTYHLAWRVCGSDYAMPSTPAGWVWPAIQQYGTDGQILFQHVCQGKELLVKGRTPGLASTRQVSDAARKLEAEWHGRIWSVLDCDLVETQLMREAAGSYSYKRLHVPDEPTRTLDLRPDGTIGEGAAACERAWCVRLLDGVQTIVITGSSHKNTQIAMMFLTEDADGVWRGRWQAHERAPVELRRLT